MTKVTLVCQYEPCSREFQRDSWDVKRGRTRFCGYQCYHKSTIGHPSYMPDPTEERICKACGEVFLVGGRGKPPKSQKLCSDRCQKTSRYRHGARANTLILTDAAYLAGFVDGEGSIMLTPRRDKVALKFSVSNTNKAILDWIAIVTGVGAVQQHRKASDTNKTCFQYQANSEAAESIIEQLLPYLIVKKEQAKLALETQERLRNPTLNADRTWQQEYIAQMKTMNQRGPR